MNAVFRKNLTEALAGDAMTRTLRSTQAAHSAVSTGIALSRRTNVTRTSGVSDPRRAGRGAKKGAAKWGSPHAPLSAGSAVTAADRRTGGTERRRRQTQGR
jgi:hypothetical protein